MANRQRGAQAVIVTLKLTGSQWRLLLLGLSTAIDFLKDQGVTEQQKVLLAHLFELCQMLEE